MKGYFYEKFYSVKDSQENLTLLGFNPAAEASSRCNDDVIPAINPALTIRPVLNGDCWRVRGNYST